MKWNIYFTFEGPGGKSEAPNTYNPVEGSLSEVLREAAQQLPRFETNFNLRVSGIRIEEVK